MIEHAPPEDPFAMYTASKDDWIPVFSVKVKEELQIKTLERACLYVLSSLILRSFIAAHACTKMADKLN